MLHGTKPIKPFCQQIDKKYPLVKLTMFFHRWSYKNSCFSELAYNSSVLVLIWWSAAWNSKKGCYLKSVALAFVLLVLKLSPIQVVISLPLWVNLTMGQLLLFFLCNFSSIFSYVRGIQSLFTDYWLIGSYILAIQQIITHKEHLRYSVAIF